MMQSEFFSPHAKDKSTMIAVGAGVTGYKARPGKVLAARLSKDQLLAGEYFWNVEEVQKHLECDKTASRRM